VASGWPPGVGAPHPGAAKRSEFFLFLFLNSFPAAINHKFL
jgi:hypothetical protein